MITLNNIRSSVKALILHKNHLLTIEKQSGGNKKYVIPGGGQEFNESLRDAVARECLEELGVKVQPELIWVREFISKNHIASQPANDQTYIVEHIFEAVLEEIPNHLAPISPDSKQTDVVWLPIDRLSEYNCFPRELIPMIQKKNSGNLGQKVYVGDIN